jgi:hypothetical protein
VHDALERRVGFVGYGAAKAASRQHVGPSE